MLLKLFHHPISYKSEKFIIIRAGVKIKVIEVGSALSLVEYRHRGAIRMGLDGYLAGKTPCLQEMKQLLAPTRFHRRFILSAYSSAQRAMFCSDLAFLCVLVYLVELSNSKLLSKVGTSKSPVG